MDLNKLWIVVEDPTDTYWEGAHVDAIRAAQLRARGVALLPVVADVLVRAGVGGYHKRGWGAGWSLTTTIPRIASPMSMYCVKEMSKIHWCARLVLEPEYLIKLREGVLLEGHLRVASDYGQPFPSKAGVNPEDVVDIRQLTEKQLGHHDGFLVGGTAKVSIAQDGIHGFALYGVAPGFRIAWSAISQAQV
jgi:hypothetical protein